MGLPNSWNTKKYPSKNKNKSTTTYQYLHNLIVKTCWNHLKSLQWGLNMFITHLIQG